MTDHVHNPDETCPLCPPPSFYDVMRERNLAKAAAGRAALLQAIAASPGDYVHLIEGFDDDAPKEAIVLHVATTLQLAHAYCAGFRLSDGQCCEIRPFRLDGTAMDGNLVLAHYRRIEGRTISGEGPAGRRPNCTEA